MDSPQRQSEPGDGFEQEMGSDVMLTTQGWGEAILLQSVSATLDLARLWLDRNGYRSTSSNVGQMQHPHQGLAS